MLEKTSYILLIIATLSIIVYAIIGFKQIKLKKVKSNEIVRNHRIVNAIIIMLMLIHIYFNNSLLNNALHLSIFICFIVLISVEHMLYLIFSYYFSKNNKEDFDFEKVLKDYILSNSVFLIAITVITILNYYFLRIS